MKCFCVYTHIHIHTPHLTQSHSHISRPIQSYTCTHTCVLKSTRYTYTHTHILAHTLTHSHAGMGEQELETEQDFSRVGRVNAMLARRLELLSQVTTSCTVFACGEWNECVASPGSYFVHCIYTWGVKRVCCFPR